MQAKAWLGRLQVLLTDEPHQPTPPHRHQRRTGVCAVTQFAVGIATRRNLGRQRGLDHAPLGQQCQPCRLVFSTPQAGRQWLYEMSARLAKFIPDARERETILINVQYEAKRAGLDVQLILGLIEVESMFRRYAISGVGARGLMQVMPFWVRHIGTSGHNLFEIRTNLRYGCTILRYYIDRERGDITRALARYNGSLGRMTYPNKIYAAMRRNWIYNGAV